MVWIKQGLGRADPASLAGAAHLFGTSNFAGESAPADAQFTSAIRAQSTRCRGREKACCSKDSHASCVALRLIFRRLRQCEFQQCLYLGDAGGHRSAGAESALMSNEQPIELEGTIKTVLPGTMFRVQLDNEHEVLAHISGKMRKHFVRLTVGDRVRMEMSPYDLTKARITFRMR
jgi:translation initiation factor IF-1